ncbi:hypothetical protein JCM8547_004607 [Rhodosporidiobolus lusitaniae]
MKVFTFAGLALAQLYPEDLGDVDPYVDIPGACVEANDAFQAVFQACHSLAEKAKIITVRESSDDALAACVCTDNIEEHLSSTYSCISSHIGSYKGNSTAYTSVFVTVINYDRLCGTTVQADVDASLSSSTADNSPLTTTPSSLTASTPTLSASTAPAETAVQTAAASGFSSASSPSSTSSTSSTASSSSSTGAADSAAGRREAYVSIITGAMLLAFEFL